MLRRYLYQTMKLHTKRYSVVPTTEVIEGKIVQ